MLIKFKGRTNKQDNTKYKTIHYKESYGGN